MGSTESTLRKYIDSSAEQGTCRDELRGMLKSDSVDTRYQLLLKVRGEQFSTRTGLHEAATSNDVETIKYMLDGFSSNQKYNVVKIQSGGKSTALHIAAAYDHTAIINYLLSNLSQQQIYNLLKIQTQHGNTALHRAARNNQVETVQAIISSVSSPLQIQLLHIKNKEGQTVTDFRLELHDELPVLIIQSKFEKMELELQNRIYFCKINCNIRNHITNKAFTLFLFTSN